MKILDRITWFSVGVTLAAVILLVGWGCTPAAKPPMPPAVIDHEAICAMRAPACDYACCKPL